MTSIPSLNLTPWISFGKWLWAVDAAPIFLRAFDKLEDHGKLRLVRQAAF
jgi:hypothetical protein